MSAPIATDSTHDTTRDRDADALLAAVRARFAAVTAEPGVRLFQTRTPDLFQRFLDAVPEQQRQWHTCSACRKFVDRHGGIVAICPKGQIIPVMWDPDGVPERYAPAVRALATAVARAPIERVYLSQRDVWGRPQTGEWRHLAVTPAPALLFRSSAVRTLSSVLGDKQTDHATLLRGLAEFPLALVRQAHTLLTTGALYRSEPCIGVAAWLVDLHERLEATANQRTRDALIWHAVAAAPVGFCRVRSTMIGTLLEDLAAGMAFDVIKARFDAKMHPLAYQRPTAPPTAGNIARAEEIVATLKSAGALERRFARLADIVPLWLPAAPPAKSEQKGIFAHLKDRATKPAAQLDVPPVVITWDKFARTVLPTAEAIELLVSPSPQSYAALVTAKSPDAAPIVQWDRDDARNPVTWYVYHNGTPPARWGLKAGAYHPVSAVTYQPPMWGDPTRFGHFGQKVFFLLTGATDREYTNGGGLFPSFLRSEYHEIRATMEAYANSAVIDGKDEAEACGLCLQKGVTWTHSFRVTSKGGIRVVYTLDRWD